MVELKTIISKICLDIQSEHTDNSKSTLICTKRAWVSKEMVIETLGKSGKWNFRRELFLRTSYRPSRLHLPHCGRRKVHPEQAWLSQPQEADPRADPSAAAASTPQKRSHQRLPGPSALPPLPRAVHGDQQPTRIVRVCAWLRPLDHKHRVVHRVCAVRVLPLRSGRWRRLCPAPMRMLVRGQLQ